MRHAAAARRSLVLVAGVVMAVMRHHVVSMAFVMAPHVTVVTPTVARHHPAVVVSGMPARRIVLGAGERGGEEREGGDSDEQTDHGRIPLGTLTTTSNKRRRFPARDQGHRPGAAK
jgi:hypothetical protein